MSPRDALKRITSVSAPQREAASPVNSLVAGAARGRLAQIMAEVAATPVENFFPSRAIAALS